MVYPLAIPEQSRLLEKEREKVSLEMGRRERGETVNGEERERKKEKKERR